METAVSVARKLYSLFWVDNDGSAINEMRLQQSLYFVQRESLLRTGKLLFADQFQGWKYGPVLVCIHQAYGNGTLTAGSDDEVCRETGEMVTFVYNRYKHLSDWRLCILSHGEYSWRNAREGLSQHENGSRPLAVRDMMLDTLREKMRRVQDDRVSQRGTRHKPRPFSLET